MHASSTPRPRQFDQESDQMHEWGNSFEGDEEEPLDGDGDGSTVVTNGTGGKGGNLEDMSGLDYLIPFINKLQTVFRTTGVSSDVIDLPQIVVVGSQSAGKSSVLESLVGKPFLPRGSGIVTRCPIVLKLINITSGKEYCEFLHQSKKKYFDFKEVQQEIVDQTKKIAGTTGVSKDCIQLTVFSPNVVTLTVVDLPGIVKIATFDLPDDIEGQIRDLILQYITPKTSIILAVTAANNDIATSDSLKLAKEVDKNGDRTLAVVTKLDLLHEKSEMLKVLKGQAIKHVKLGVVGVINRTQEEIEKKTSFKDTLAAEKKFLMREFPSIASQHGTPFLAQRLNRVLLKHIEDRFPELDMRLKQLEVDYKDRLQELGRPLDLNEEEKRATIIEIIAEFAATYKAQVDGSSRHINVDEVCGGARIDHIFQVNLHKGLEELSPLHNVTNEQIITAIRNSRQIGSRLYIPEDAFQELVKKQIRKMRQPVLDCANQVYHEMLNMVQKCLSETAQRFPKVNRSISHILSEILHEKIQAVKHVLEQYIDIQSSSAITAQVDFYELMERMVQKLKVNGLGSLPLNYLIEDGRDSLIRMSVPLSNGPFQNSPQLLNGTIPSMDKIETSDDETFDIAATSLPTANKFGLAQGQLDACDIVRALMTEFFTIVLKQVQDFVPKSILFTMVYATVDHCGTVLNKKLTIPEKVTELMMESERIVTTRDAVCNDMKALEEACQLLEEIREKSVF